MQLVHFYTRIELRNKGKLVYTLKSMQAKPYNAAVDVTINYSNDDTPSTTDVTLHGLIKSNSDKFIKGSQVDIYAGFFNSDKTVHLIKHQVHGTITTIQPRKNDSGDWQLTFTMQDGEKYDNLKPIKVKQSKNVRLVASQKSLESKIREFNSSYNKQFNLWRDKNPHATDKQVKDKRRHYTNLKKAARTELSSSWNKKRKYLNAHKKYQKKTIYQALSFKAGTKGSAIIKKVAKEAGISIGKVDVVYDHVYLKGYVAKKKPMNVIREVAGDCNTNCYWQHGYLMIKDFAKQTKLSYVATPETGLLQPPEYQEDSENGQSWELSLLYNPDMTTGVVFKVKHPLSDLKGWVIVLTGTNTISSGSTPTSDVTVMLYDDYKAQQAKKVKNAKNKDASTAKKIAEQKKKEKAKKDKEKTKDAKSKRAIRRNSHKLDQQDAQKEKDKEKDKNKDKNSDKNKKKGK
ncbi:hypothetical protein [Lentilactobacillus sp. SPB1-3]|uniref:Uncharacterized protein n=1 Tax=Lentilactobacillus terminaliae TaxID=3003483 RepID=A0ACD5DCW8_9LACO|nr:hypothetical protein [Lentilactobacillus sp. SPB1-3]MCZ0978120.1 hypothetical protein [Lentilactobacillus sp. SPB1-3]